VLVFLLIVLLLMFLVSIPRWPWSREWGYDACTGIGVLLAAVSLLAWLQIF